MMLRQFDRGLAAVSWVAAALVVVLLFAGPSLIGAKNSNPGAQGSSNGSGGGQTSGAGQTSGPAVFASAGCGGCHTLKAAHASGGVGPNLDELRPSAATVAATVRSGAGTMPSFSGKLSDAQITAVAAYVSNVAGR